MLLIIGCIAIGVVIAGCCRNPVVVVVESEPYGPDPTNGEQHTYEEWEEILKANGRI